MGADEDMIFTTPEKKRKRDELSTPSKKTRRSDSSGSTGTPGPSTGAVSSSTCGVGGSGDVVVDEIMRTRSVSKINEFSAGKCSASEVRPTDFDTPNVIRSLNSQFESVEDKTPKWMRANSSLFPGTACIMGAQMEQHVAETDELFESMRE